MEDQSIPYTLLLIPAAPLAAALWLGTCGQWWRRSQAHRPAVFGLLVSFLAAVWLWAGVLPRTFTQAEGQPHAVTSVASVEASAARGVVAHVIYRWVGVGIDRQIPTLSDFKQRQDAGGMSVRMELRADALSALMLVMVTSVSLLVAIFAAGYMHGDPGYPRFFAALSLFVFSMTMLVLSGNYLQLFIFWEGVGLCSYLLIGYWFHRPSAAAAAMKAFVVNRVGDLGLILGIFLIWTTFGTLDFDLILSDHTRIHNLLAIDPTLITTICLLLLIGAIGKSAQFPLHVWLPDAMEGPTPVSALIHAATMVTAGVYLVARSAPLFAQSSYALHMVAGVGAITALIAAISALAQYDLKRVLAYSTISQLGYMFMGLGAAGADPKHLMPLALASAMFHLFTHAYFKAVLFLSAGSVMHAMGDVIDMRRFSGLRHALPITHGAFLAGALALAGIPLLSGFWSKDEIVSLLWTAAQTEDGWFYRCVWGSAVVTALLTRILLHACLLPHILGPRAFSQ
ncbi:MAG: hypothetical protein KatS3mg114_0059 [Planctomycetaceae bacterium]|nr:MAG: hypothetical protein KatS3mg114_0059 [Planctomycetaceae bacterium]